MAYEECSKTVTLIAGADLRNSDGSSTVGEVVTLGATGVVKTSAVTSAIYGVLASDVRSDVSTLGKPVTVAVIGGGGVLKMKAGAAISPGQLIVPHTSAGRVAGKANIAALVAHQMAAGVALSPAANGDVFSVLAQTIAAPHTN